MENVLRSLDGVVDAKADYVKGLATVSYDPAQVTPDQMVEAINTKTFFRASLPLTEGTTTEARGGFNPLPFIVGGVLVLSVGAGIWLVIVRRQAKQANETHTSQMGGSS